MLGWVGVGVVIPLPGFVEVGVELVFEEVELEVELVLVVVMVVSVVGDVLDVVELAMDEVEDVVGAPPVGRLGSISTQYEYPACKFVQPAPMEGFCGHMVSESWALVRLRRYIPIGGTGPR